MKKLLFGVIIFLLMGCGQTLGNPEEKDNLGKPMVSQMELSTTQTFAVKNNGQGSQDLRFTGYGGVDGDHWFISFSEINTSAVNYNYYVKEGDTIHILDSTFTIVRLEPENNKIIIGLAQ